MLMGGNRSTGILRRLLVPITPMARQRTMMR